MREKGRLYSACVCSLMLYRMETWPVKEEHVIRLERSDLRMVRWLFNFRPKDRISAGELRTRLKLKSIRAIVYRLEDCNGLVTSKNGSECLV